MRTNDQTRRYITVATAEEIRDMANHYGLDDSDSKPVKDLRVELRGFFDGLGEPDAVATWGNNGSTDVDVDELADAVAARMSNRFKIDFSVKDTSLEGIVNWFKSYAMRDLNILSIVLLVANLFVPFGRTVLVWIISFIEVADAIHNIRTNNKKPEGMGITLLSLFSIWLNANVIFSLYYGEYFGALVYKVIDTIVEWWLEGLIEKAKTEAKKHSHDEKHEDEKES